MGPLEVLLIVVLALIVFGPAKLPEIMGQVGKAIGDFRRATSELSDEFNRTIKAEIDQTRATIEEPIKETRATLEEPLKETRTALDGSTTPAPQRVAAPPSDEPSASASAAALGPNPNGNGVAEAPPLADTSQWNWETSPGSGPVEQAADRTPDGTTQQARDELLPPY
jgi:TatA/E family protein of Tat protein translocase